MATRETDGARVSRLRRSCACALPLLNRKKTKPEEKERLLAVYRYIEKSANNWHSG